MPDASDALPSIPGLPSRFVLTARLGAGGQGETFAARDEDAQTDVVVKVFRLAGSDAWKRFELFERECAVLRSLDHRAIPKYVEHGGDEDSGTFYLVMQRAVGSTLQAHIDAGKRFTDAQLLALLEGLLDALEYLHSLNPPVIHRDLKPGNVVLQSDGAAWLVDFGSVRDVLNDPRASTVVGTFGYMAPEQLRGEATPASDVYGLGATLAAAATGTDAAKLPTAGLDLDLSTVVKAGRIREVLTAMTRSDPRARPGDVAAVRAHLAAASPRALAVPPPVAPATTGPVERLVAAGNYYEAIRVYREQTGAPLADAKQIVDGMVARVGPTVPQGKLTANDHGAMAGLGLTAMFLCAAASTLGAGVIVGCITYVVAARFMVGFRRTNPAPKKAPKTLPPASQD
ncbi:MAG: serine/threonine-protein kinase [Myxococcota bacterium]